MDSFEEPENKPLSFTANSSDNPEDVLELEINGKKYISISLLAKETGYEADHISRLARQGKVDGARQGKRWYVLRESIADYRKKAEEHKRTAALEGIKVLRKEAIESLLSRKPKTVPSLALFQIVEHIRASRVSLRPLLKNGFGLILLALFVFSFSIGYIGNDVAKVNKENGTGSILSTIS